MKPSEIVNAKRSEILKIALSHNVENVRIFGSIATGSDNENSDLDLLVDATERTTLFDIAAIQSEIEGVLGIKVDVVTSGSVPERYKKSIRKQSVRL